MTKVETVLRGLEALCRRVPGVEVHFLADRPEAIPLGGLLIVRGGDPGEPEIVIGSPPRYDWEHRAVVEVHVQRQARTARAVKAGELLLALGDQIAADPTLGGAVDHAVVLDAPVEADEAEAGMQGIRWVEVTVTLYYTSNGPLS